MASQPLWRQDELSALQSFIDEQQQWLDSVLDTLGWNQERLTQIGKRQPRLMQCPYNQHHFIDKASLERHKLKCRYGVTDVVSDFETVKTSSRFVKISPSIFEAVKKFAKSTDESTVKIANPVQQQPRRDFIDQSDVVVESHDQFSSLESRTATPQSLLAQGPLHIIRYIKSWSMVPADFHKVSSASLNPVEVKAWLFTNLPNKHTYSSHLGGEIQAVEAVLQALTSSASITPDAVLTQLTPLFNLQCRSFVLKLWKFLHVAALQRQHTILDSVVEDLAPLPSTAVSFLEEEEGDIVGGRVTEPDSFADKIQAIAAEEERTPSPLPPLPPDNIPHILTPLERRLLYDYVVEVGGAVPGSQSKDPGLFRDDAAAIKAKLKQQAREESERVASEGGVKEGEGRGRESALNQMKRERDYRRRRQKYRARNVHITRRTPAQVMRDIISARMKEISGGSALVREAGLAAVDDGLSSKSDQRNIIQDAPSTVHSMEREERKERDSGSPHRQRERSQRSRSRERARSSQGARRSRHSRSRERRKSRSKSRERRKRHDRKERDRKRSRDREDKKSGAEKSSVRETHKHHSRSEKEKSRVRTKSEKDRDTSAGSR
jgi:U11/U12 small nuclear ribonucleoprotein SNRNP48